ncbi:hypothetical protein KGQ19_18290 [Catenulispora sp. NL8]|uniref:DNA-binding phage zinc finger domain-containing protein n=1 Tax=Catenulispora pinistramenti TaxID=2705254 RepID=A0ABS5KS32_9ACTN|nr:hypothetical protein [Catenulispora pinistramenti]MBS2548819.1 hypothetical protein [Catenulispora pinistramenti]
MTPSETVKLLRMVAAACPAMRIEEHTPEAWHMILGDQTFADCVQALRLVAREQTWIAPADLIAAIRRIRAERIERANLVYEPAGEESARDFCRRLATMRRTAADGDVPARSVTFALPAGVAAPPDIAERAHAHRAGLKVLQVACPFCKSPVGSPCQLTAGPRGRRPHGGSHPSRKELAGVSA